MHWTAPGPEGTDLIEAGYFSLMWVSKWTRMRGLSKTNIDEYLHSFANIAMIYCDRNGKRLWFDRGIVETRELDRDALLDQRKEVLFETKLEVQPLQPSALRTQASRCIMPVESSCSSGGIFCTYQSWEVSKAVFGEHRARARSIIRRHIRFWSRFYNQCTKAPNIGVQPLALARRPKCAIFKVSRRIYLNAILRVMRLQFLFCLVRTRLIDIPHLNWKAEAILIMAFPSATVRM